MWQLDFLSSKVAEEFGDKDHTKEAAEELLKRLDEVSAEEIRLRKKKAKKVGEKPNEK